MNLGSGFDEDSDILKGKTVTEYKYSDKESDRHGKGGGDILMFLRIRQIRHRTLEIDLYL